MAGLADLSAVAAGEALGRREISAVELLDAVIARISEVDPQVRAWRTMVRDRARRDAAAADVRAKRGRRRSPLDGIPVGVKDLIDTAGIVTSYGSPLFAGHVPTRDAHIVGRLRRRGLVVIGKTVTTQFATFDPAETRNPLDLRHTPGGSSAGSAAAVAARMVPLAVGTQTGGSTIRPASYCGVVGFMPSPGWIGRTGIFPCSPTLDRVGLFARSIQDTAAFFDMALGRDRLDPESQSRRRAAISIGPPRRVGLVRPLLSAATPRMRAAVLAAAGRLADAGIELVDVDVADHELAQAAHLTIMAAEVAEVHGPRFAAHPQAYAPRIAGLVRAGQQTSEEDLAAARAVLRRARLTTADLFRRADLLMAPAAAGPAERGTTTTGDPVMNLAATFRGLPALSLPMPVGTSQMPLGLQLMGPRDQDRRLLGHAAWVEMGVLGSG